MKFQTGYKDGFSSNISPILAVGLLVFVLTAAFSAYVALKKSSLTNETDLLEASITNIEEQAKVLNDKGVATALSAKKLLDEIDSQYLKWSGVIQRIQNTVPKNVQGKPKVDFLSYSGGRDGKLNLTTRTSAFSADPYKDTAELIRSFNTSNSFMDAFVPGLSKTTLESGSSVLDYTLQLSYQDSEEKTVSRK